jgi:hypothetical protein
MKLGIQTLILARLLHVRKWDGKTLKIRSSLDESAPRCRESLPDGSIGMQNDRSESDSFQKQQSAAVRVAKNVLLTLHKVRDYQSATRVATLC